MTAPQLPPKMNEEQERRVDRVLSFARNVLILVVVVAALGALSIAAVFGRLGEIRQTQADGVIRGYRSRTPDCVALLLSTSTRLPNVCTEDAVLPYVCEAAAQTNPAWVERIEMQVGHPCPFPPS